MRDGGSGATLFDQGNGVAGFHFETAGHIGQSFDFSITVSDEFGSDTKHIRIDVLSDAAFQVAHFLPGRDFVASGSIILGTFSGASHALMFGDSSTLLMRGQSHDGQGCFNWFTNASFAYSSGGSTYHGPPGPDVITPAASYGWAYAPGLPPDIFMGADSAIDYFKERELNADAYLTAVLEQINAGLPSWTAEAGVHKAFAKLLWEQLEDPNVQAVIQQANETHKSWLTQGGDLALKAWKSLPPVHMLLTCAICGNVGVDS